MWSRDKGLFKNYDDDLKFCNEVMYDNQDYECCTGKDANDILFNYLGLREKNSPNCSFMKSLTAEGEVENRKKKVASFQKFNKNVDVTLDPTRDAFYLENLKNILKNSPEAKNDPNFRKNLYLLKKYFRDVKPKSYQEVMTYLASLDDPYQPKELTDMIVLYDGPYGKLTIPKTYEASCKLGSKTQWCTASKMSDKHYKEYTKDGPLFIWHDNVLNTDFQFHFESDSFMDAQDKAINKNETIHLLKIPILNQLFKTSLTKNNKIFKFFQNFSLQQDEVDELEEYINTPQLAFEYANSIRKDAIPEYEWLILQEPSVAIDYAIRHIVEYGGKGFSWPELEEILIKNKDIQQIVRYADLVRKDRWIEAEDLILTDPVELYNYLNIENYPDIFDDDFLQQAEQVIYNSNNPKVIMDYVELKQEPLHEEPFPGQLQLFETISRDANAAMRYSDLFDMPWDEETDIGRQAVQSILTSPKDSYLYAEKVLRRPWPEAEKIISKDPSSSISYAINVLDDTFPLAEENIAKNANLAYEYALNVVKGRFVKGEDVIARNPEVAFNYAKNIIRGRWYEAEPYISTNPVEAFEYALKILKSEWPEGESAIAKNGETSLMYAKKVLFGPFQQGEKSIAKDAQLSLEYARDVLEGPFEEGEKAIAKEDNQALNYAIDVLNGPFPKGEGAIARNGEWSLEYAMNALRKPFPKGEKSIFENEDLTNQYFAFLETIMDKNELKKKYRLYKNLTS